MSAFQTKFDGMLYGLRSWEQLNEFWRALDRQAIWYLYAVGLDLPQHPVTVTQLETFIERIDALLHKEHQESYCGIVYVDDVQAPTFVVIYDPSNLGVSCGSSKNRVMPGWVMCQTPPELVADRVVIPNNRKKWWNELLAVR